MFGQSSGNRSSLMKADRWARKQRCSERKGEGVFNTADSGLLFLAIHYQNSEIDHRAGYRALHRTQESTLH